MEENLRTSIGRLYGSESWLGDTADSDRRRTHRFSAGVSQVAGLVRESRTAQAGMAPGEKYMIVDRAWYGDGEGRSRVEIRTWEYADASMAREGLLDRLVVAERLERRDGIGELAFEGTGYLCFVRNNVCVALFCKDKGTAGAIAALIDRQIVDATLPVQP